MKTPREARRQICPFKLISGDRSKFTRVCEAYLCMMWRPGPRPSAQRRLHERHIWEEPPWDIEKRGYVTSPRPDDVPPSYEFHWVEEDGETWWVEPDSSVEARWPGYCGLAGRPRE